jgi:hypothetical protein
MADQKYCSGWWDGCWIQSGYSFGQSDADYGPNGVHPGIDIGLPEGTSLTVPSPEHAKVLSAGWRSGTGNTVILQLDNGTRLLFGHLSTIDVKQGDYIGPGRIFGKSGHTGNATGSHLHFEVQSSTGVPTDPVPFLMNSASSSDSSSGGFLGIPGAIDGLTSGIGKTVDAATTNVLGFGATMSMFIIVAIVAIGLILVGVMVLGRGSGGE